jgi:hypothetical protein
MTRGQGHAEDVARLNSLVLASNQKDAARPWTFLDVVLVASGSRVRVRRGQPCGHNTDTEVSPGASLIAFSLVDVTSA